LFSVAISATALDSKTTFRQNGVSAMASWLNDMPDGTIFSFTDLSVTETDDGTDIYMNICELDLNAVFYCRYGYMFTQQDVFDINKKLTAATLKPMKISLYKEYCDENGCLIEPAGEATIEANWAGTGDIMSGSNKFMSRSGDFIYKSSDKSSIREATATGSIEINDDGQNLGTSDYGSIVKFKSTSMSMEK